MPPRAVWPFVVLCAGAMMVVSVGSAVVGSQADPTLAIEPAAAPEGNARKTRLVFAVVRNGDLTGRAAAEYAVRPGTASASTDFVARRGRIVFAPGVRVVPVVVFVNGDRVPEADESLALELLSATGARIRRSEALGLVVDDDTAPGGPTVAVAGDVACDPADRAFAGNDPGACQHRATAALVGARPYVAILVPGDLQYERGELDAFRSSYGPTWGRFKARTRPAPGNHEYNTAGATGYYDYFGPAVGRRSEGWYSFDVGDWHVVALNSNCAAIGGCDDESRQAVWLRGDLARNPARCTLAFWHHPLFTSGAAHVGETVMAPLWRILEAAGADLVVAGHAHQYERFAPQTRDGAADPSGIREIVVGTGGRSHQPLAATVPNSLVRDATTFGILELTLGRSRYSWRFVPAVGPFRDSGSARCD